MYALLRQPQEAQRLVGLRMFMTEVWNVEDLLEGDEDGKVTVVPSCLANLAGPI